MAKLDPQVNFRIPDELRRRLQASAADSGRTLTAEIVLRLERSYSEQEGPTDPTSAELRKMSADLRRYAELIQNLKAVADS